MRQTRPAQLLTAPFPPNLAKPSFFYLFTVSCSLQNTFTISARFSFGFVQISYFLYYIQQFKKIRQQYDNIPISRFLSAQKALISSFDLKRDRFEKHRIERISRSQNPLAERHLAAVGCYLACGLRLVDSLPRNRLARAGTKLIR